MEIVEHVSDLDFFIKKSSELLKKNGIMFIATINKTFKSYLFAIVGAEYILKWLPIGTHEWDKFVIPKELEKICLKNKMSLNSLDGVKLDFLNDCWSLSKDKSVNYISIFKKD